MLLSKNRPMAWALCWFDLCTLPNVPQVYHMHILHIYLNTCVLHKYLLLDISSWWKFCRKYFVLLQDIMNIPNGGIWSQLNMCPATELFHAVGAGRIEISLQSTTDGPMIEYNPKSVGLDSWTDDKAVS